MYENQPLVCSLPPQNWQAPAFTGSLGALGVCGCRRPAGCALKNFCKNFPGRGTIWRRQCFHCSARLFAPQPERAGSAPRGPSLRGAFFWSQITVCFCLTPADAAGVGANVEPVRCCRRFIPYRQADLAMPRSRRRSYTAQLELSGATGSLSGSQHSQGQRSR
jgi:hypothetical protein